MRVLPSITLALAAGLLAGRPAAAQPKRPAASPATPARPRSAPPPAAPPPGTTPPLPGAAPAPATSAPPAAEQVGDVDALRREVDALRDQLFRSRARAAAVASALYSSKLRVVLSYASGRYHTVTSASVRLDGASVYHDDVGQIARGAGPRFDGFVAPGRHVLTIRVEATGKDDDRFTAATEATVAVQVPQGKDVVVTATARDDGDIAYAWKQREAGSYRLGLDVAVASAARAGAAPSAAAPARPPRDGRDASRRAAR